MGSLLILGISIIVFQAIVGSLLGAVVLRAACAVFNRLWGGVVESSPNDEPPSIEPVVPKEHYQPIQADFSKPYAAPTSVGVRKVYQAEIRYADGVRAPSFGSAFCTCLIANLIHWLGTFVVSNAIYASRMDPFIRSEIMMWVLGGSLFAYFLIFAGAVKTGLQTSYPKAIVVTGLYLLIFLSIAVLLIFLFAIGVYGTAAYQH